MGLGLPQATRDYFLSLDMPIFELYGLSESSGVHALSRQQDFRLLRWVPVDGRTDGRTDGGGRGRPPTRTPPPCSVHGHGPHVGVSTEGEGGSRRTHLWEDLRPPVCLVCKPLCSLIVSYC